MPSGLDKATLRQQAMAARKIAHATVDPAPALAALEAEVARRCPPGATVAGYAAIRTEIDPRPLLDRLAARGYRLCLPVVLGPNRPLILRAWMPGAPLVAGAFGAKVPEGGETVRPDLVIAPLIGFDAARARLGYGGGYYDRTLAELRADRAVPALGLAYDAQRLDAVPTDPTDVVLDAVITEARVY